MAWGDLREPPEPLVPSRPILSPHLLTEGLISRLHVWRLPGMKGFAPESGFEKTGPSRVKNDPDTILKIPDSPGFSGKISTY